MVTLFVYPADMEGEAPMTNGYSNGVESTGGAELSNNHQTPDTKKHSSSSHSSSKDKHKHSSSKVRYIIMVIMTDLGGGGGQNRNGSASAFRWTVIAADVAMGNVVG